MDIDGQHDKRDPFRLRAEAQAVLALHVPASETGCCNKCGRSTADNGCDAPEVLDARRVLQEGRPEYRVPGANHQGARFLYVD